MLESLLATVLPHHQYVIWNNDGGFPVLMKSFSNKDWRGEGLGEGTGNGSKSD